MIKFRESTQTLAIAIIYGSILLLPVSSLALNVTEVPNPRQEKGTWVADMAGVLDDKTEAEINRTISELETKNGTEMAVVTVKETSPAASPKEFATELFNYWGIGKKGQDNGVLFLISVGERRVEIETGYGVEAILPDAKVGEIIQTQIVPNFKKRDFEGGTLAGTKALVAVLRSGAVASPTPATLVSQPGTGGEVPWGLLAAGGILTLTVGGVFYLKRSRKTFIAPEGRSLKARSEGAYACSICHSLMKPVAKSALNSYLTEPQKIAEKIGSSKFEAWECPNCSSDLPGKKFHLIVDNSSASKFRKCLQCRELTVVRKREIITHPTIDSEGEELITDKCQSCSQYSQRRDIIPRLPTPIASSTIDDRWSSHSTSNESSTTSTGGWLGSSLNSSSSDSSWSGSSSSSDSSWSSSSSSSSSDSGWSSSSSGSSGDSGWSSSGSDFGGGSSGGGGAGGSW